MKIQEVQDTMHDLFIEKVNALKITPDMLNEEEYFKLEQEAFSLCNDDDVSPE